MKDALRFGMAVMGILSPLWLAALVWFVQPFALAVGALFVGAYLLVFAYLYFVMGKSLIRTFRNLLRGERHG